MQLPQEYSSWEQSKYATPEVVLQLLLGIAVAQVGGVHQGSHVSLIAHAALAQQGIVRLQPLQLGSQGCMDCRSGQASGLCCRNADTWSWQPPGCLCSPSET